MPKGDHLIVSRGAYQHHGLDLGQGQVMQYGNRAGQPNARVEIVDTETFSQGYPIKILPKPAAYHPDEIIARAKGRLGEQHYSLIWENCEHFVNWCRTGESKSKQVDWVAETLLSSATKLAANYAAGVIVKSSAKAGAKAVTRGITPWLIMADAAQLTTELAAAKMGAKEKNVENMGRLVGAGTSAGIGGVMGGPVGALVGAGLWAVGETIGKHTSAYLLQKLKKSSSPPSTCQQQIDDATGCSQEKPHQN
uniref:Lecithin retinol acyltransferase n=1 Tax=Candidatus Kentrum sp. MB TaxID=2138164 RepID=A0A451BEF8_9GAMM|nr:MAG: Lecithin retinol acyltransferase [Candidatus Kentron sp. MB]VFK76660.1 MAG: Lecithin retinol acyltransferase [Candidatus Kentron sp. MB]